MEKTYRISVILPVRNESLLIRQSLTRLLCLNVHEIIVVDGASLDNTAAIVAAEFPRVRLLSLEDFGRAKQMNAGAKHATGDVLWFVPADAQIPADAVQDVAGAMSKGFDGGAFYKEYDPRHGALLPYEALLNHWYLGWQKNFVTTNAFFVRRDVFESMGGYPQRMILEDVELSRTFKAHYRLAVIRTKIRISSRRYQQKGALRQIGLNLRILLGYGLLHEKDEKLKRRYDGRINTREGRKTAIR